MATPEGTVLAIDLYALCMPMHALRLRLIQTTPLRVCTVHGSICYNPRAVVFTMLIESLLTPTLVECRHVDVWLRQLVQLQETDRTLQYHVRHGDHDSACMLMITAAALIAW